MSMRQQFVQSQEIGQNQKKAAFGYLKVQY